MEHAAAQLDPGCEIFRLEDLGKQCGQRSNGENPRY